jgi:hypothetical protein
MGQPLNSYPIVQDSDAPSPEKSPIQSRSKKSSANKAGTKPRAAGEKGSHIACSSHPSIKVSRTRENSGNRTFIVLDNVTCLDTDGSSSDTEQSESGCESDSSDTEMMDTVPENVDDLNIDMQPRYAYNARILAGIKRM